MSIWVCNGCGQIIHSSSEHFFKPCGNLEYFDPVWVVTNNSDGSGEVVVKTGELRRWKPDVIEIPMEVDPS